LIGRDIPEIHHVHEQILGDKGKPFAQKLPLGWVIIGEVCLGKVPLLPKSVFVKLMFSTMDEVLHFRYVKVSMEQYDEDVSAQRQRQELQPQVSHSE
jgi:hypothetical protein